MKLIKHSLIVLITLITFTSCSESRKKATEKINELNQRADEFNAVLDEGIKNIESIDSLVRTGAGQIEKYDSLLTKSTSRSDSIAQEKAKAWEELTNF